MGVMVQAAPARSRVLGRYSLRALLGAVTLLAIVLGLIRQRADEQRRTVEMLRTYGAGVAYRHQQQGDLYSEEIQPWTPKWLRDFFGEDYFVAVYEVRLVPSTDSSVAPVSQLTSEEFAQVCRLRTLRRLWIEDVPVALDLPERLCWLPNLNHILWSDAALNDKHLEHLGRISTLRRVSLSDSEQLRHGGPQRINVTARGIGKLGLRLDGLYLYGTKVDDAGVAKLSAMRSLYTLDLIDSPMTDAGVLELAKLRKLRLVDLSGTLITDIALETLGNMKIWDLSLARTAVSDAGLAMLNKPDLIGTLNVAETNVAGQGLEGFTSLSTVDLAGCCVASDALIHLTKMPRLSDVNLNETKVNDADMATLAGVPRLRWLHLRDTEVTDAGLKHLTKLPLAYIDLTGTNVTEAEVDKLRKATGAKINTTARPKEWW